MQEYSSTEVKNNFPEFFLETAIVNSNDFNRDVLAGFVEYGIDPPVTVQWTTPSGSIQTDTLHNPPDKRVSIADLNDMAQGLTYLMKKTRL